MDSLRQSVDDAAGFLSTAQTMMEAGQGEEFVTFDKPAFEIKKKEFRGGQGLKGLEKEVKDTPLDPERSREVNKVMADEDIMYVAKEETEKEAQEGGMEAESEKEPRKQSTKREQYDFEEYKRRKESEFSGAVERKVPSSPITRAFEFGKVGSSIIGNSFGSIVKNTLTGGSSKTMKDYALSEKNSEKLTQALCKMRGAALKLGQAFSMAEDHVIPANIKEAFKKARQSANIMPNWQLEQVLVDNFGASWKEDNFESFEMRPFAAASIGQVHKAVLKDGKKVVLKIQYPGVANSIDSDLDNLKRLMDYTGVFPKSMFLDDFIKNTRIELNEECDYIAEAQKQTK